MGKTRSINMNCGYEAKNTQVILSRAHSNKRQLQQKLSEALQKTRTEVMVLTSGNETQVRVISEICGTEGLMGIVVLSLFKEENGADAS